MQHANWSFDQQSQLSSGFNAAAAADIQYSIDCELYTYDTNCDLHYTHNI